MLLSPLFPVQLVAPGPKLSVSTPPRPKPAFITPERPQRVMHPMLLADSDMQLEGLVTPESTRALPSPIDDFLILIEGSPPSAKAVAPKRRKKESNAVVAVKTENTMLPPKLEFQSKRDFVQTKLTAHLKVGSGGGTSSDKDVVPPPR